MECIIINIYITPFSNISSSTNQGIKTLGQYNEGLPISLQFSLTYKLYGLSVSCPIFLHNVHKASFSIQYACRKTLADSRPRIRGRFAKNEEIEQRSNFHMQWSDIEAKEDYEEEDNWVNFIDAFSTNLSP